MTPQTSPTEPSPDCPSLRGQPPHAGLLESFLEGLLPDADQRWWERHTAHCHSCQARIAAMTGPAPTRDAAELFGASIAVVRLGPARAPLSALQRVLTALATRGWRVSSIHEAPLWAAFETSSQSLTGSPVDSRKFVQGLRVLQELVPPGGPVAAYVEVGRGLLGHRSLWGEVFSHTLALEAQDRLVPGRLRLSTGAASLISGLGIPLVAVSTGMELVPQSSTLQRLDAGLQTPTGFWSGTLSALLDLVPRLTLIRETRGASPKSPTGSASTSAPVVLAQGQRLQLELQLQPGMTTHLLWETRAGWMRSITAAGPTPGSAQSAPQESPTAAPTRCYPALPPKIDDATLWTLTLPVAFQGEMQTVLEQTSTQPTSAEALAEQFRAHLTPESLQSGGFVFQRIATVKRA